LLHPKTVHNKAGSQYEPYSDFGCSSNTVDFGDLRFTLARIFSRQLKKRRSRFRLILTSRLQELHEGMIWSLVCAVFLEKPFCYGSDQVRTMCDYNISLFIIEFFQVPSILCFFSF
jgi:hypothetical protein